MKILANKDFTLNGKFYSENDEVKVKNVDELIILNEKGFIKPLTRKEISQFQEEVKNESNI